MRYIQYLLLIVFLSILGSITILHAQEECDIDTAEVIDVVEDICTDISDNQICYGNFDVSVDVLDDLFDDENFIFNFDSPGDIEDIIHVQSLYLSALNPEEDIWGIAQMRLLTATKTGSQELNILLFGDVKVENAVEPTLIVEVQVGIYSANIRNLPLINAAVLQSVEAGNHLEAVGRLEDNSWVRIRTKTGAIGWISTQLIAPINENEHIDDLEIQDSSSPYFGPMQAFYFEQGSSSNCGNLTSNGLLIQTPQGSARVNVSINGVNINLIPGQTGATALVQGSDSDITISMIQGEAYIESYGIGYFLNPSDQSSIPMDEENITNSEPTFPTTYDTNTVNNLPTFSLITTVIPIVPTLTTTATSNDEPIVDETTNTSTINNGNSNNGNSNNGNSNNGNSNNSNSTNTDCSAGANANANACTNNAGGNGGGNGNNG